MPCNSGNGTSLPYLSLPLFFFLLPPACPLCGRISMCVSGALRATVHLYSLFSAKVRRYKNDKWVHLCGLVCVRNVLGRLFFCSVLSGSISHLLLLLLFSCSVMFNSAIPRMQHTRLPCPLPSPRACSNSCPLSQWCHPTISSSVTCFNSFYILICQIL